MGLTIKHAPGTSTATITALEEVWADKDGNPVPYGDVDGKSVLVGKGSQISIEDAVKAGLIPDPAKAEAKAKADAEKTSKAEAEKLSKAEKAEAEAKAKADADAAAKAAQSGQSDQGENAQP